MIDRVGQVWWARWTSTGAFELCVVLSRKGYSDSLVVGWMLQSVEHLGNSRTFGHFESQFANVENGGCDA